MAKCPKCDSESTNSKKEWTYSAFDVKAFCCSVCGTKFRTYARKGKDSFILMLGKDGQYRKPHKT